MKSNLALKQQLHSATVHQFPTTAPQVQKAKHKRGQKLVAPAVGKMLHSIRAYSTAEGTRYLAVVRVKGFAEEKVGGFADFDVAHTWKTNRIDALKKGAVQRMDADISAGPGSMMITGKDGLLMRYADGIQASDEPMSANVYSQYLRLAGLSKAQLKGNLAVIQSINIRVVDLNAAVLTAFCDERKKQGVKPATITCEYSRLSTAIAGMAFKNQWYDYVSPMTTTIRKALFATGKLGESEVRERRPETGEFPALINWFTAWEKAQWADRPRLVKQRADNERYGKTHQHPLPEIPPMADILRVAVLAGPRRSTLINMRWSKFEGDNRSIQVAVKDKNGDYQADSCTRRRDTWMPIIPAVVEIIERQPRVKGEDRIFPYSNQCIQRIWKLARQALKKQFPGIETLRFHDLRHEAATQILDAVKDPLKAMKFTTHKTLRHFQRYVTHGKKDIKNMAEEVGSAMQLPQ